jgi:transposase
VRDLPPKIIVKKRKTDGAIGLAIKRIRHENPKLPFRDFEARLLEEGFDKNAVPSKSLIADFLKKNGFILRKLIKKTGISATNIKKRADWCRIMIEKPAEFWDRVIWSDETTVRQAPKGKDIFVHVHQNSNLEDLGVNSQLHSGGFSVMFWGCFSKKGLGPLVALEGSQTAETYVGLLEDVLLPELQAAGGPMIFMQDNAPCHKAKRVNDFFGTHDIDTLEWPAQSPDMNPIENLWAIIKARRQKKFGTPKTKSDLITQIFDIWDNIEDSLVEKLADSANKRVSEVLRLNGKISKY